MGHESFFSTDVKEYFVTYSIPLISGGRKILKAVKNKWTTSAGVLGADKGMFLALCARILANNEAVQENEHYRAGLLMEERPNLYVRKTTFRVEDGSLDFHQMEAAFPFFTMLSQDLYL